MSSFGHEWLIDEHDHEHTPSAPPPQCPPPVDNPERVPAHSKR